MASNPLGPQVQGKDARCLSTLYLRSLLTWQLCPLCYHSCSKTGLFLHIAYCFVRIIAKISTSLYFQLLAFAEAKLKESSREDKS
ncbi:hypothetical protein Y032_0210g2140 [Ancylostoma ceylanicum]|nr:hypothetical protein Y032_0210g2140 [Ancylostoma ceylanicum]